MFIYLGSRFQNVLISKIHFCDQFQFFCIDRINDRKLLLFGFILTFIGFTIYLPWGNTYPKIKPSFKDTLPITSNTTANTTFDSQMALVDFVGCPEEYSWCHDTPQMHMVQLVLGMLCLSVGYPLVMVLTTSMYSKIIGPRPQVINPYSAMNCNYWPIE